MNWNTVNNLLGLQFYNQDSPGKIITYSYLTHIHGKNPLYQLP